MRDERRSRLGLDPSLGIAHADQSFNSQPRVQKMHKRFFGGRSITAALLDSSKKYRKSGQGADVLAGTGFEQVDEEEEREEQERMDKYQKWLEAGGETPMAAKD